MHPPLENERSDGETIPVLVGTLNLKRDYFERIDTINFNFANILRVVTTAAPFSRSPSLENFNDI